MSNLSETLWNLSKTLQKHLNDSAKKGSPSPVLCAQIAWFTATISVSKTRLYAEHDSTGITTALSYQIISAVLISNSWRLSQCKCIHGQCGFKVNSIANGVSLILGIGLEKLYEKSLSSLGFAFLGFALSITVLLLILLVIIQPSTDLGVISFLIGFIGSVAYNLFGHKFQTWMVAAICFLLLSFRAWLEQYWLGVRVDHKPRKGRSSKSETIEAVAVAGFHLFWVCNLFRTNCRKIGGPPKSISCALSSIMGMPACLLVFILWFGLAVVRVHSLFQTKPPSYHLLARGDEEGQLGPMEMLVLHRSRSAPARARSAPARVRSDRPATMSVDLPNETSLDLPTVDYDLEPTEAESPPLGLESSTVNYDLEPTEAESPPLGLEPSTEAESPPLGLEPSTVNYDLEPTEAESPPLGLEPSTVDDDLEPTEAESPPLDFEFLLLPTTSLLRKSSFLQRSTLRQRKIGTVDVEDLPPIRRTEEKEDHNPEEESL
ncbi:hypothetical protein SLA2020_143720 [Shorea laevis]